MIWLASYPKSGNTWMRALLAGYFQDQLRLNELGMTNGLNVRSIFDDLVGLPSANLTQDEIEYYWPAAWRELANELEGEPHFVKTHAMNGTNRANRPLFPSDVGKAVYIVRNPLDVAVSLAPFFDWPLSRSVEVMNDESYVLNHTRHSIWTSIPERLGSWSSHVASWIEAVDLEVFIVRYEDLHTDASHVLKEVLRFAGLQPDPDRIHASVSRAEFTTLQRLEAAEGFTEHCDAARTGFFRRGRPGGWRDELSLELAQAIVDRHGAVMRRLGYESEIESLESRNNGTVDRPHKPRSSYTV